MADRRITVFLADDNVIVREGVRALLGARGRPRGRRAPPTTTTADRRRRGGRAPGARHRHPHAAELPAARASTRPRSCASATPAPAWSCSRSTTTPSTRSRCSPTAPPATPTSSRTASPRATSSPGPCARSRPAARCSTRRSSRRSCSRSPTTAGSPRPTRSCSTRSPRAGRSRRSPRRAAHDAGRGRRRRSRSCSSSCREGASDRHEPARCKRLRMLHQAIVDREEQGETLSRLLPGGLAEKVRSEGRRIGETEELVVTVLMWRHPRLLGDRRAHATRRSSPRQLSEHRAEMNHAILDEGGTVMQFVGDAVMACFGAPVPLDDHADRARRGRDARCIDAPARAQRAVGGARACTPFGLGIGAVDRAGRGGAARLRGAARVHARRRHREPRAAAPGPRPARGPRSCSTRATYAALHGRARVRRRSASSWSRGGTRRCTRTASTSQEIDTMTDDRADEEHRDRARPSSSRGACARRSSPRARRCARCAASTSR